MAYSEDSLLCVLIEKIDSQGGHRLSPAERAEALRIAQGLPSKDAASVAGLSVQTIRTLRKLIYRKLRLGGSHELLSTLLQASLAMLASID
jgi:DNA-binding CsgD family transcriptional regulator